jgi:hypothetical protein
MTIATAYAAVSYDDFYEERWAYTRKQLRARARKAWRAVPQHAVVLMGSDDYTRWQAGAFFPHRVPAGRAQTA